MKNELQKPSLLNKIMKTTVSQIIILLIFTGISFAGISNAQEVLEQQLSVNFKNRPLKKILREIEDLAEIKFAYSVEAIGPDQRISLVAKDERLRDVLDSLFKPRQINYQVIGKQIILQQQNSEKNQSIIYQQGVLISISGKVTSENGEVLPGVTVLVKGTSIGSVTDLDGNFSINAPNEDDILVFSSIGYISQEIAVNGRSVIEVVLAEDIRGLDEVVVVGYGTQKKETLTGSVSTVKGRDIVQSPTTNVSNSLVGRLAGVSAVQRSGQPGSDGSTIRIRGVNTLGNNDALIVVDGIPGRSLDRIDPTTIESVTVLKDASAAIYGSQAANGVILITTKRGQLGKPEISVNLNQGFNQPTRIPEMANSAEYATMLNEIDVYSGRTPGYTSEEIQKFKDGSDPWSYPNTDWFAEVIKPRSNQNFMNASIAGGSEYLKYFVSLGTKFQDGYYFNSSTNYKQHDLNTRLDLKISENVNIELDLTGRYENRNNPIRGIYNIYRMVMRGKPTMHAYYPDGSPGPDLEYGDNPVVVSTDASGYDNDKRYILNSTLKLNIKIPWVEGLSLSGWASLDKSFQFTKQFTTPWYLYSWDGQTYDENNEPVLESGIKGFTDARLRQFAQDNQNILLNSTVNYVKSINNHSISLLGGIEGRRGIGDQFEAFRRYFISTSLDQLFAGGDLEKNNSGSGFNSARLNYFGRVNYDFEAKYLIEFVGRYDGSYIFPAEKRYGFFPGVSAGWRLSQENFWKNNLSFIDEFKLRGSWGQTGNDRIEEWQYLPTYGFNPNGYTYIFGHTQQNQVLREERIPNPNVTWEVANQSNIGIEAFLLDYKLSVELDYFDNRRSQILWQRNASVPASSGLTLPRENIGKVTNRGFDFNLSYQDQIQDLFYTVSLNGGYAKNKITFWDEAPGAPEWQRSTGRPIGSSLYYEAIGIFNDEAEIDATPSWPGARPGDIIYNDVNSDGIIDANDRVRYDKNNIPRFNGGLNLDLKYRQFTLSVLFQGASGSVRHIRTESGDIGNFLKDFYENRWTPENPEANGPRTSNRTEYWELTDNTYFLYKTDYIRLKNLQLGYSFPSSFIGKFGLRGLNVFASAYNLITYSPDLKDFDPEADSVTGYPVQKVINGGININF